MTDKGWKGSTCQVATHKGVIVGRCADCGKRKAKQDKEVHA